MQSLAADDDARIFHRFRVGHIGAVHLLGLRLAGGCHVRFVTVDQQQYLIELSSLLAGGHPVRRLEDVWAAVISTDG